MKGINNIKFYVHVTVHRNKFLYNNQLDALISQIYFGMKLYMFRTYVEIKCQLDATEVFIADLIACSTCFGHHYAHHQEL